MAKLHISCVKFYKFILDPVKSDVELVEIYPLFKFFKTGGKRRCTSFFLYRYVSRCI